MKYNFKFLQIYLLHRFFFDFHLARIFHHLFLAILQSILHFRRQYLRNLKIMCLFYPLCFFILFKSLFLLIKQRILFYFYSKATNRCYFLTKQTTLKLRSKHPLKQISIQFFNLNPPNNQPLIYQYYQAPKKAF